MIALIEAIRKGNAILFVGAGVSATLNLPTFAGLVDDIASELNYDPDVFRLLGDFPVLAEYYQIKQKTLGKLRSRLDVKWHGADIDISKSVVHRLIVNLNFPVIYTTNWDRWIERAFSCYNKPFTKIVSVGDLSAIEPSKTQIIKFHGDFDSDSSLILTESSYFSRFDFEMPLDIKLRSDILGKTVLFIGYSLTDANVRYMLYKLHRLWHSAGDGWEQPKSFMFLVRPNDVQQEVLRARGIDTIVSQDNDPRIGLEEFLKTLLQEAFGRVI